MRLIQITLLKTPSKKETEFKSNSLLLSSLTIQWKIKMKIPYFLLLMWWHQLAKDSSPPQHSFKVLLIIIHGPLKLLVSFRMITIWCHKKKARVTTMTMIFLQLQTGHKIKNHRCLISVKCILIRQPLTLIKKRQRSAIKTNSALEWTKTTLIWASHWPLLLRSMLIWSTHPLSQFFRTNKSLASLILLSYKKILKMNFQVCFSTLQKTSQKSQIKTWLTT
jgi:hypothetical protein